jgi:hypothetical protein
VRSGTYSETVEIDNSLAALSGSSWSDAPRIVNYPGEIVTVTGGVQIYGRYVHHLIIDGLVIDGNGVWISQGAHHTRIQNCEIRNAYGSGVEIFYDNNDLVTSSDYHEIINCNIHHNGRWNGGAAELPPGYGRGHGLYISTSHNLIEGCEIHHNGEWAVHFYAGYSGQY